MRAGKKTISMILLVWLLSGVALSRGQEYTVQVLSSTDKTAAEKLHLELQQDGLPSYIAVREDSGLLYRVRIGHFKDKREALKLQQSLKEKAIESWIAPADMKSIGQQQATEKQPKMPDTDEAALNTTDQDNRTSAAGNDSRRVVYKPSGIPAPAEQEARAGKESADPGIAADNGSNQPQPESPSSEQSRSIAAAEVKLYELVIHPVPSFTNEQPKPVTSTSTIPPCRSETHYVYYNPQEATLHIAADRQAIPVQYRNRLQHIDLFPAVFKSMNFQDMSVQVQADGQTFELILDGILQDRQHPAATRRDLESLLAAGPLRMVYFPAQTDPDGTLHGALFFSNGSSVASELVRQGFALCQDGLPYSGQNPCR